MAVSPRIRTAYAARVFVAVALAPVVLSGCGGTHRNDIIGTETIAPAHSCGYLAVGKGWRVSSSPNGSCDSARQLIRAFFSARKCSAAQSQQGTSCSVEGYDCFEVARPPDTGVVSCLDAKRNITVISNP